MAFFKKEADGLCWQENQRKVWINPVGRDAIRVQANLTGKPLDLPQALVETDVSPNATQIEISPEQASLRNGNLRAVVENNGRIHFFNASGSMLLEEPDPFYYKPPNRHFRFRDGKLYGLDAWFMAQEGECLWN